MINFIFVTFSSLLNTWNTSKFDYFDLHVLINLRVFKLVKKSFAWSTLNFS